VVREPIVENGHQGLPLSIPLFHGSTIAVPHRPKGRTLSKTEGKKERKRKKYLPAEDLHLLLPGTLQKAAPRETLIGVLCVSTGKTGQELKPLLCFAKQTMTRGMI
jgi:hypothetical protein